VQFSNIVDAHATTYGTITFGELERITVHALLDRPQQGDMSAQRIVADVGGTNVRFARADGRAGILDFRSYQTASLANFLAGLSQYLCDTGGLEHCGAIAIAAAGPVEDGETRLTNVAWCISEVDVSDASGGLPVRLVNDVEAVAYALPELQPQDVLPIGPIENRIGSRRPMLALNIGTGFGAATVVSSGRGLVALPGEPGHMTFSPVSLLVDSEDADHKSIEDVLSGRGVVSGYESLRHSSSTTTTPTPYGVKPRIGPKEIFASVNDDPIACMIANRFTDNLGRVAGDLVLATGSWGGVFLCGGVIEGWGRAADSSRFRRSFEAKGAMGNRMRGVFTGIIMRPDVALLGLSRMPLRPLRSSRE
jgi:glucokinase